MRTKTLTIVMGLSSLFLFSCATKDQSLSSESMAERQAAMRTKAVRHYTTGWPSSSIQAARIYLERYGEPNESTPSMLVWNDISPFVRITVFRNAATHKFPLAHKDVIEHVVSFKIPTDKTDDLTEFDGSVTFNRTRGELASISNNEAMNLVALNLASDIIRGRRDVANARAEYGKQAVDYLNGNKTAFAQGLQFMMQNNTADADQSSKFNWAQAEEARPEKNLHNQNEKDLLKQAQEEEIAE